MKGLVQEINQAIRELPTAISAKYIQNKMVWLCK